MSSLLKQGLIFHILRHRLQISRHVISQSLLTGSKVPVDSLCSLEMIRRQSLSVVYPRAAVAMVTHRPEQTRTDTRGTPTQPLPLLPLIRRNIDAQRVCHVDYQIWKHHLQVSSECVMYIIAFSNPRQDIRRYNSLYQMLLYFSPCTRRYQADFILACSLA
jgi:hypothetical protein